MADPFDRTLDKILSGRNGARNLPTNSDRPVGSTSVCDRCKAVVEWKEYRNAVGRTVRFWSDCACIYGAIAKDQAISAASVGLHADQRTEVIADVVNLAQFTLSSFSPAKLTNGERLIAVVSGWLTAIHALPYAPSYYEKPRCCLYFYSSGKGRGKTHLAAALLNEARGMGKLAAFADEINYIESYWAAPLEARARMSALPADKAWLTVFDDMGAKESTGAGLRDAWYDLINPRWLKRGWTVITSNHTPDDLLSRGTINDATYSRIVQMTQGQLITFDGVDQRLEQPQ